MMDLRHFANLHGRARIRKAVLILERIEREWQSPDDLSHGRSLAYARDLAELMAASDESSAEIILAARNFLLDTAIAAPPRPSGLRPQLPETGGAPGTVVAQGSFGADSGGDFSQLALRTINHFRHALMAISGQSPADWDFISAPRPPRARTAPRSGMRAYLEDIRSPFNVGSIFRTAEALGFEELILSPECADPLHPRALRTAMGTVGRLPWRRAPVSALAEMEGVFALEVGGSALQDFAFPLPGIMVLGSEELGVSREALGLCSRGCAEIPLVGSKASLNVATAFGIAGFAWLSRKS
jgi:TrmH family RNA methyltransferase